MMGLNAFRNLSIEDRQVMTQHSGELIATRYLASYICELYILNGYFVEIVKNKNGHGLDQINSFLRSNKIDKYLDQIELKI